MHLALENAGRLVADDGQLFVAIYNAATGFTYWRFMKRLYNHLPKPFQKPFVVVASLPDEACSFAFDALRLRPLDYLRRWRDYYQLRGMSRWYDLVDWVGGFPYEVARPEEIFEFYRLRGFRLETLETTNSLGCNQFVFTRVAPPAAKSGAVRS